MEAKEESTDLPMLPGALPTAVVDTLNSQGGSPSKVRLAANSDLSPDGQFGEQWLLIDADTLWVINRHNGTADLRYTFPLDHISDAAGYVVAEDTDRRAFRRAC